MKIREKYRTIISILISVFIVWFVGASVRSAKNTELSNIVESFESTESFGNCTVEIRVRKDWLLGWSPSGMSVDVSMLDNSISTTVSQFFPPDRIHLRNGNTSYHYTWSESEGDYTVATTLDFEISRDAIVQNVQLKKCMDFPINNHFIGNLSDCKSEVRLVQCS